MAIIAGLAAVAVIAARVGASGRRWAPAALALAALAGFFAIPGLAKVQNYPRLHTPDLAGVSAWARANTPRDAVFMFADAGYGVAPGIFREDALRAIYVDWKGGGQVNYLRHLGEQWWQRWQAVNLAKFRIWNLTRYAPLGIDYLVLQRANRLPNRTPVFENSQFLVYQIGSAK
jgi:hypothetical protein